MSDWLEPVRQALAEASEPVTFFVRDDDAGWNDERLFALLDLHARHEVPLDLAVIPAALTVELAQRLCKRLDDAPQLVGVHQHGYCHANHQAEGRKCEFGAARTYDEQRADIERGQHRLRNLFERPLPPIFTPPWNRCTATTARCLVELGLNVLSRDRTAEPLGEPGLHELPIAIDWFAHSKGVRLTRAELGARIAAELGAQPVGIMLHHAVMAGDERAGLDQLLHLLATHPAAHCRQMAALTP